MEEETHPKSWLRQYWEWGDKTHSSPSRPFKFYPGKYPPPLRYWPYLLFDPIIAFWWAFKWWIPLASIVNLVCHAFMLATGVDLLGYYTDDAFPFGLYTAALLIPLVAFIYTRKVTPPQSPDPR